MSETGNKATTVAEDGKRKRVEKFLRDIGTSPAQSSSRNPLEQVWTLTETEFARRARSASSQIFHDARDETYALTEHITRIERELMNVSPHSTA